MKMKIKKATFKVFDVLIECLQETELPGGIKVKRIRAPHTTIMGYLKDRGKKISTSTIHYAIKELEQLKIIEKVVTNVKNGGKVPSALYEFKENFYLNSELEIVDRMPAKRLKRSEVKKAIAKVGQTAFSRSRINEVLAGKKKELANLVDKAKVIGEEIREIEEALASIEKLKKFLIE
jgi:hypothetical protein